MIPFLDLKAQYSEIKDEIATAIELTLESGQYVLGDEVSRFEAEFAAYCGARHGVAVNSGTSALHLALLAAGVGPGDEVVTVPFTFVATVAAITYIGARPVLVDVDPKTLTLDVDQLEAAITARTKAIVPVHLYGHPADLDPILEIANRHHVAVIEDAAQAHGAEYQGQRIGGLGAFGCFSFYPGKNLGAYGEGGMVVTSDPDAARMLRMLRDWGQERKYNHVLRGFNYRMDGLQGAILRVKLRHLERWTEARRARAAHYRALLQDADVVTPAEMPYARHVYHTYTVRSKERDELQRQLLANGVHTNIHYPIPVHLQPAFADLGYKAGDFPRAERAAREVLSLPMYPELSYTDQEMVAAAVRQGVQVG